MPELPDVEYFMSYFSATSLHQKITGSNAPSKRMVKQVTFENFQKELIGREFQKVRRRGKYLITGLKDSSNQIIFHFGMTGSLKYVKSVSARINYSQLAFFFDTGTVFTPNQQT
jgi:formamidopyrimidine-DNA glycosylase